CLLVAHSKLWECERDRCRAAALLGSAFAHKDFHAAVAATAFGRVVGGHGLHGATAFHVDAAAVHTLGGEVVAGGFRTVQRQRVVDGVAAGAVGVAHDAHIGVGI